MKIIFFDTETTGLDPQTDEIISYAFGIWEDGETTYTNTVYLTPTVPVSEGAARVNGYTPELWASRGAKPFSKEHYHDWVYYLQGPNCRKPIGNSSAQSEHLSKVDAIGGSNVLGFDLAFVKAACARFGLTPPKWPHRICELNALGFPLWVTGKSRGAGLGHLAQYFNISDKDAHSAEGDVKMSVLVWEKFLEKELDL